MQASQFELHAELEDRHWWFRGRRCIVRRLVQRVFPPANDRAIVDVGCGTGASIAAFTDQYACLGIDPTPEAIALARSRFPQVSFICGSVPLHLEMEEKTRLFLLLDVLEHVADDAALLTDLAHMMRPGEQLLITVPADMALWSQHDVSYGHYLRYDPERLCSSWADLPFSARLVSHFNVRLYPIVRALRTLGRWRKQAWGSAGTDLRLPSAPINRLLENLLAGESKTLLTRLEDPNRRGFRRGVSLIALLRREAESA